MTCRTPLDICAMRLSRLTSTGVPDYGFSTGMVELTGGLSSLKWTPQYFTTPDIAEPDGCGNLAIIVPPENLLKRYDVELDALVQSAEMHELAYGATLLTDGADVIGHAVSLDVACGTSGTTKPGVVLEAWSKNWLCDDIDPDFPYLRVVFSKVKFSPAAGNLARGPNHLVLTGPSFQNGQVGDGPAHDFPEDLATADPWTKAEFGDTALPEGTECGYGSLPVGS